ncbi:hypothetical protein LDENG_00207800 [Lucifuga dentata]|nr:hypothetical protein LDENG_00207800 [Lucifuga dentata]
MWLKVPGTCPKKSHYLDARGRVIRGYIFGESQQVEKLLPLHLLCVDYCEYSEVCVSSELNSSVWGMQRCLCLGWLLRTSGSQTGSVWRLLRACSTSRRNAMFLIRWKSLLRQPSSTEMEKRSPWRRSMGRL